MSFHVAVASRNDIGEVKFMDETYNIKAIVLKREDFRESDSRITVYSRERGKMSLVVRGAKKLVSKLSSHIEPVTLVDIMVVAGKNMNYVGGAESINCFTGIKNNFSKLQITGEAMRFFDKIIKPEFADIQVFELLEEFLRLINSEEILFYESEDEEDESFAQFRIFLYAFIMKLLSILGYQPDLRECVVCKKTISENEYKMDYMNGGLVCLEHSKQEHAVVPGEVVKFLRILFDNRLNKFIKFKIQKEYSYQFVDTVKLFTKYLNIV